MFQLKWTGPFWLRDTTRLEVVWEVGSGGEGKREGERENLRPRFPSCSFQNKYFQSKPSPPPPPAAHTHSPAGFYWNSASSSSGFFLCFPAFSLVVL